LKSPKIEKDEKIVFSTRLQYQKHVILLKAYFAHRF